MTGRRLPVTLLVVALVVAAVAATAPAAGAKKLQITSQVNQVVPVTPSASPNIGHIKPTITVGKKFRGRKIRDVNVTFQTTGNGPSAAAGLDVSITAPNGATQLLNSGFGGESVGPVTFDDETPFLIAGGSPCPTPFFICEPYVGSARASGGEGQLAVLDGGPVRGTWTLTVLNFFSDRTSTLNFWRLNLATGKPYQTK